MTLEVIDDEASSSKKQILSGKKVTFHRVNIGNMILNTFKSTPNFIGQIDAVTGEQTTFQQMREKSVKCALWLRRLSCSNTTIAVCTSDQMLAYIPFLASLYIGATINPWYKIYFKDQNKVKYFLLKYKPKVIFIDSDDYVDLKLSIKILKSCKELKFRPKIITFDRFENVDSLESILNDANFDGNEIDQFSCEILKPETTIAKMLSSNATKYSSKAKIRYFALTCPANQTIPAMSAGDIGLWYGSLTWNYSIILIVRSIIWNVTVIKPAAFTNEDMYKTIEKYKVTWVFLDSSLCNQMFQTDIHTYDISSLKQFIYGDSPIQDDICQSLIDHLTNVSIIQVYSISEACIIAAYEKITPNREFMPLYLCGQLTQSVQIMITRLRSEEIKVLPLGVLGKIWYRFVCRKWCKPKKCKSPNCCNYQAKEDKINIELYKFFSEWRCSEDYGFVNKDSNLFVIEKIEHIITIIDNLLIINILPKLIEKKLNRHSAIAKVVVVGVPNTTRGQCPKIYIERKDDPQVTKKDLTKFVKDTLYDMFRLRGLVKFLPRIPYLPNGKINRGKLL